MLCDALLGLAAPNFLPLLGETPSISAINADLGRRRPKLHIWRVNSALQMLVSKSRVKSGVFSEKPSFSAEIARGNAQFWSPQKTPSCTPSHGSFKMAHFPNQISFKTHTLVTTLRIGEIWWISESIFSHFLRLACFGHLFC